MSGTVLITGANGFLGTHIARLFTESGWRVIGLDVTEQAGEAAACFATYHALSLPSPEFRQILRQCAPAVIIHCAGLASVPQSMTDPAADFQSSVALTFALLNDLRLESATCRFILVSSAAVYGDPDSLPVNEEHRIAPLSPYGYHKRQCEQLCAEFAAIYGLSTVSVRIFSAYGEGLRRQVVWDICEKVLTKGQLELSGTGAESRDFIHARDVAEGLLLVAEKAPCKGEIYNLASGREVTISALAHSLLRALGSGIQPRFDGRARPGNPLCWCADITKIAALGFAPTVPFEQGIAEVADWARSKITNR